MFMYMCIYICLCGVFQMESQRLLEDNSASVYLKRVSSTNHYNPCIHTVIPYECDISQVEKRIAEEGERAQHFLDPSTESRITKVHVHVHIFKPLRLLCVSV